MRPPGEGDRDDTVTTPSPLLRSRRIEAAIEGELAASVEPAGELVCPRCGASYSPVVALCPRDGAPLVP